MYDRYQYAKRTIGGAVASVSGVETMTDNKLDCGAPLDSIIVCYIAHRRCEMLFQPEAVSGRFEYVSV
jgi:hypothetical protein